MTGVGYEAAKGGKKQENKTHKLKCKYIASNKISRTENTRALEGTAAELRPCRKLHL